MAKKLRELGVSERQKIRNFSTTLEYQTRKVGKKKISFSEVVKSYAKRPERDLWVEIEDGLSR